MAVLHLVLGAYSLLMGAVMIVKREWLAARVRPADNVSRPATLWVGLGALFVFLGLTQLALGFV